MGFYLQFQRKKRAYKTTDFRLKGDEKMGLYLGIDTSNYTTSVALYDTDKKEVYQQKQILTVSSEAVGLRQSDAVFAHVKQLSSLVKELFCKVNEPIKAVCVSSSPRRAIDSYMPCFLVGKMVGESIAVTNGINCYYCSHQEGHITSAALSANKLWILKKKFYAFHVSGGTTECLYVKPSGMLFSEDVLAKTLDINAGQLIDRTGVMLGIPFPCGKELDRLARLCKDEINVKTSINGLDCNLSGFQNKTQRLKAEGRSDSYIARFAIESVKETIVDMRDAVIEKYGKKPILYAGGVMSNSIIRKELEAEDAFFAEPEYSSDNAAGVAVIGAIISGEMPI